MSTRTPEEAIAWARSRKAQGRNKYSGRGLKFVTDAYGIPSKYASAAEAWENTQDKRRLGVPPTGSFVWFSLPRSPHGAVGIMSSPEHVILVANGAVQEQSVQSLVFMNWNYLGWSWHCNDVNVNKPVEATYHESIFINAADMGDRTKDLYSLGNEFKFALDKINYRMIEDRMIPVMSSLNVDMEGFDFEASGYGKISTRHSLNISIKGVRK